MCIVTLIASDSGTQHCRSETGAPKSVKISRPQIILQIPLEVELGQKPIPVLVPLVHSHCGPAPLPLACSTSSNQTILGNFLNFDLPSSLRVIGGLTYTTSPNRNTSHSDRNGTPYEVLHPQMNQGLQQIPRGR